MAKATTKVVTCLIQNCDRKVQSRGLCSNHYQSAQELVKKNETSWEELETHALAKPAVRNTGLIAGLLAIARGANGENKAVPAPTKAAPKKAAPRRDRKKAPARPPAEKVAEVS